MDEVKEVVSDEPTMEEVAKGVAPEIVSEVKTEPVATETEVASEIDPLINQDKVREKINKISAEKNVEKRKREALELKVAELEKETQQVKPVNPGSAPQLEDFDFDDVKHQEALTKHQEELIQYQVNQALEVNQQATNQQQADQVRQKAADDFFTKQAAYSAEHPGYDEALKTLPTFDQETLSAIYELGPQVVHYMTKNLDAADQIANASPTMAAVKLGQISMGLTADTKIVKPSNAPEPVEVINGAASVDSPMDEWSMDEIMART